MDDVVKVAVITGCVALVNGPLLLAVMSQRWRRNDELTHLREDVARLFKLVNRVGAGLDIGLRNDKVIFKALRDNSINGESEIQERIMDEYFTGCTLEGFKSDREE